MKYLLVFVFLLSGCSHASSLAPSPHYPRIRDLSQTRSTLPKYTIVLVQENRTVDNLFQKQPGVDTQSYGIDSHGNNIPLVPRHLGSGVDCDHSHKTFVLEVTVGFDKAYCPSVGGRNAVGVPNGAFSYVDPADIKPYTALATQYAIADEVLQSNEGPSFPAHIYLIAATAQPTGTTWDISENDHGPFAEPFGYTHKPAGCNSPPTRTVTQMDMTSAFPGVEGNPIFPCIVLPTIFDELDGAGISWKYYTPSVDSIWAAPYAIKSLYDNDKAKMIVPETTILSDIQNGNLAQVSYVIPSGVNSDHPARGNSGGPAWVASVVNALGSSQYWNQCAVIVTWDDWGGWYDHVALRHPVTNSTNPYEYGLRVPLLAIGPYARPGFIDHTQRDFASVPHFIEDVYGLASLGQLDAQTDDLFSMFNFGAKARKFTPIPTGNVTIKSLINRPPDLTPVDSD